MTATVHNLRYDNLRPGDVRIDRRTDLGLNSLTDDQIVELVREIGAEMARRNPGVLHAAKLALVQAVEKATKSQDNIWAVKKWLATMVVRHIGDGYALNVWKASERDEVRVYLEKNGDRKGRGAIKYCLYLTGNSRNPPGSVQRGEGKADEKLIAILCRQAFERFPGGVQIDCDTAAALDYDIPPEPPAIAERLAQMAAHREWNERRYAYREHSPKRGSRPKRQTKSVPAIRAATPVRLA